MAMTLDEWVLFKVNVYGPVTQGVLLRLAAGSHGVGLSETEWRKLDRALQRLRKAGKIRFDRKGGGWSLAR
jgi:hypothetical protein